MAYAIKEVYYTLQGEGYHSGRAAVFLRFSGCNLWSGREEDRASAICQFCDTEFFGIDGPGGGKFDVASDLADHVESVWGKSGNDLDGMRADGQSDKFVVCTGGEPLLQLDTELVEALHARGFELALETNGTLIHPPDIDWVCVSPKADAQLVLTSGDELKLVFPQSGAEPEKFAALDFGHFYLQPMDGDDLWANTKAAIEYCLKYPSWKLSLQTHKLIGIP